MSMDFNNFTGQQRDFSSLIPAGTTVPLITTLRPGGAGPEGMLKKSKAGDSEALDFELTVTDGEYKGRKLWMLSTVSGITDGQAKAGEITSIRICAMLEAARGIRPSDQSDSAKAARRINSYGELDGLQFLAKIGIEKGSAKPGGGNYPDKNCIAEVITPDRQEWRKIEQTPGPKGSGPKGPSGPSSSSAVVTRPDWGRSR
jgi:hypothetical protein